MKYIAPESLSGKFTCPHCDAISHMHWQMRSWTLNSFSEPRQCPIRVGKCTHCDRYTLWLKETLLYPDRGLAPPPDEGMPAEVKRVYSEAASIAGKSPRGAAALLRLAIQILCRELGQPGENVNSDIKALVAQGLPPLVQESLDIVRVTGNHAVHPGQIDVDDEDVVATLFGLVNHIVHCMITMPAQVMATYEDLPESARLGIARRDSSTEATEVPSDG